MISPDLRNPKKHMQQAGHNMMLSNDDVQWNWTLLSVKLWVIIRGFSLAATWLEIYKSETRKTVKKTSALRKELAQKELDT